MKIMRGDEGDEDEGAYKALVEAIKDRLSAAEIRSDRTAGDIGLWANCDPLSEDIWVLMPPAQNWAHHRVQVPVGAIGGEEKMEETFGYEEEEIGVAGSGEPATHSRNAIKGYVRGIMIRIYPPMIKGGLATIQVGDGLELVDCCSWAKSVLVWKTAELLHTYLSLHEVKGGAC